MVSSVITSILSLAAFAGIHSLTASLPFKRFVLQHFGEKTDKLYLPAYSIVSMLTILPLIYSLYKNPGKVLYKIPSPWRWLMIMGQLIAGIATFKAFTDARTRFKISSQLAGPDSPESEHLIIQGIYKWIRDPFLLSGLVSIWLTPIMTVNLFIIDFFATIYLFLGSLHWESRLVAQFGDEYLEYRKKVHKIIPGLKRS
ncbi:MAG: NnrU family protein [Methanosarcina sp.]